MSAEQYGTIRWAFFRTDADGRRLFCPTGRFGRVAYLVESEEMERALLRGTRWTYVLWIVFLIASVRAIEPASGSVIVGGVIAVVTSTWSRRVFFWPLTRDLQRIDAKPPPADAWLTAARSMNTRLIVLLIVLWSLLALFYLLEYRGSHGSEALVDLGVITAVFAVPAFIALRSRFKARAS